MATIKSNRKNERNLFNYMEKIISRLKLYGKLRTSETYTSALNSFRKFRKGEDIAVDAISSEVMQEYEAWLRAKGLVPNTIGFYTRILRAVYNRAVADELTIDRRPFRKVYTGVDKTMKRAVPKSVIRKIIEVDLSNAPALDYARDMFLMSFYLRGMSFIDMAYLKKSDLRHGYIVYRRRKTDQQLTIAWESEMQAILNKYPENPSCYLLPVITDPATNERNAYRNKSYNINRNLKKVSAMIGISVPVTLYVARHSWASIAKANGVPVGVISEGLGHDSEATTRIYLTSLDASVVDRANAQILKSLQE